MRRRKDAPRESMYVRWAGEPLSDVSNVRKIRDISASAVFLEFTSKDANKRAKLHAPTSNIINANINL